MVTMGLFHVLLDIALPWAGISTFPVTLFFGSALVMLVCDMAITVFFGGKSSRGVMASCHRALMGSLMSFDVLSTSD
jgi:hypothetical protein